MTNDDLIRVDALSSTPLPQTTVWLAMHQCYSDAPTVAPAAFTEENAGLGVVKHLLAGNRGHFSPLEHVQMALRLSYVPHDALMQLTRHRHLQWSVQSFRYTSGGFLAYAARGAFDEPSLRRLVYFHPSTSKGDKALAHGCVLNYAARVNSGCLPEQARGLLPFNLRQHAVMSGNLRALWHTLDLRLKADTQPECRQVAEAVVNQLRLWVPQLQEWYDTNRASKARLSP